MTEKTKSALVTGGAGFIGSHMTDCLIENGWQVTVLDNLSTGSYDNLKHLENNDSLTFVTGDIEDKNLINKLVQGKDAIFHFAAMVSVPLSIEKPEECFRINVAAFDNILLELVDSRIPIFYASSAAVYGNREEGLRKEDETPNPLSPYGESKVMNEKLALEAWNAFKVPTVGFRFFNVYGPRQNPIGAYASVIPKFCDAFARGIRPVIYGDGSQTRDFIHVKDLVRVLYKMIALSSVNAGRVFNVATGSSVSVNELLLLIASKMNKTPKAEKRSERLGDIKRSAADISALRGAIGNDFCFKRIEEGLKDTVKWYAREAF